MTSFMTKENDPHQTSKPSPLKINRESDRHRHMKRRRTEPVIIYTESPKIIHTQARDFMALVQKLTGLSGDDSPSLPPEDTNRPACNGGSGGNLGFSEIPLFTPSEAYGNGGTSLLSPTFLEFMKGLPES